MAGMYNIFGRQVAPQYLSMAILGSIFGGSYLAINRGGSKKLPASPPINASSSNEEDFIKKFLEEADGGNKDAPAPAKN